MPNFERPVVAVSECLEFTACRYNGRRIPDGFVRRGVLAGNMDRMRKLLISLED